MPNAEWCSSQKLPKRCFNLHINVFNSAEAIVTCKNKVDGP